MHDIKWIRDNPEPSTGDWRGAGLPPKRSD